jgi:hypothetical protein
MSAGFAMSVGLHGGTIRSAALAHNDRPSSVLAREFASFHIVTHGRCCLEVDGLDDRVWLSEGDLVILPAGHAHTVRDSPSSPATRLEELVAEGGVDARGTLRTGGGGAGTVLVCGGFHWEDRATTPIVASLPPIIHLQGRTRGGVDTWLRLTLAFLSEEADAGRAGAEITVTRLADLLFIEALRTYFSAPGTANCGEDLQSTFVATKKRRG